MKFLLFLIITLSTFLFSNPLVLAKEIANKEAKITYYYWANETFDVMYLGKQKENGEFSVWVYTGERKWKPLHNTCAFDGFPMAEKIYESVIFKDGSITIKGSSPDEDRTLPPSPGGLPESDTPVKVYSVSHYFWVDNYGKPFLAKKTNDNKVSIWHYTRDRKWLPMHQAKAFDNFSGLKKTLESVSLDTSKSSIKIGAFSNHLENDFKLTLSSTSLGEDNSLPNYFLKTLPSFSWSQDMQYDTINEAYILQIRKKDGFLVFSNLFLKETKMNKEISSGDDFNNVLPSSITKSEVQSPCNQKYTNYNTNNDEKIEYEATIYAIYDVSILNDKDCMKNIKTNFLAKKSLNYNINTNITVGATKNLTQERSATKYNINGTIELKFFNHTLKQGITDYSKHINIKTNTEINTSISSVENKTNDEYIRLEINKDGKSLYIFASGTSKKSLKGKYIELTFLQSLFSGTLKETQKSILIIKETE